MMICVNCNCDFLKIIQQYTQNSEKFCVTMKYFISFHSNIKQIKHFQGIFILALYACSSTFGGGGGLGVSQVSDRTPSVI